MDKNLRGVFFFPFKFACLHPRRSIRDKIKAEDKKPHQNHTEPVHTQNEKKRRKKRENRRKSGFLKENQIHNTPIHSMLCQCKNG
jgi:hypothetical protein